jgi:hypothetical protein
MKNYLKEIIVVLFLVIVFSQVCTAEEIAITSLYPSPSGTYSMLKIKPPSGANEMSMSYNAGYFNYIFLGALGDGFRLSHNGNSNDFVINNTGFVGFGTDIPTSPVQVVNASEIIGGFGDRILSGEELPPGGSIVPVIDNVSIYAMNRDCGLLTIGDTYGIVTYNYGNGSCGLYAASRNNATAIVASASMNPTDSTDKPTAISASNNADGSNTIRATSIGNTARTIYASATGTNSYAGYFEGNTHITGDMTIMGRANLKKPNVLTSSTNPSTGAMNGDVYFNTGTHKLRIYYGGSWYQDGVST